MHEHDYNKYYIHNVFSILCFVRIECKKQVTTKSKYQFVSILFNVIEYLRSFDLRRTIVLYRHN